MTTITLKKIQQQFGGTLEGNGDVTISGVNSLEHAGKGELTFATDAKYHEQICASQASAVIVTEDFAEVANIPLLRVGRPKQVFSQVMCLFQKETGPAPGIHPATFIDSSCQLADQVAIGERVTLRAQSVIGARSKIEAGSFIGEGVTIGCDCWIGPNVTLQAGCTIGERVIIHAGSVIGTDGFGYAWDGSKHAKIPQLGSVVIEDDVEIGGNVCIDRGTFGETRIGRGSKLDNLVHIAHNVVLGEHVAIAAQVGIAGSTVLKNGVVIGGCAAISDHVTVGEGAMIGGAAGVTKDVAPGDTVWGTPARTIKQVLKEQACVAKLPELMKEIRKLIKN